MEWKIGLSREAEKSCDAGFLSRENVLELIRKAIKKFKSDFIFLQWFQWQDFSSSHTRISDSANSPRIFCPFSCGA